MSKRTATLNLPCVYVLTRETGLLVFKVQA